MLPHEISNAPKPETAREQLGAVDSAGFKLLAESQFPKSTAPGADDFPAQLAQLICSDSGLSVAIRAATFN